MPLIRIRLGLRARWNAEAVVVGCDQAVLFVHSRRLALGLDLSAGAGEGVAGAQLLLLGICDLRAGFPRRCLRLDQALAYLAGLTVVPVEGGHVLLRDTSCKHGLASLFVGSFWCRHGGVVSLVLVWEIEAEKSPWVQVAEALPARLFAGREERSSSVKVVVLKLEVFMRADMERAGFVQALAAVCRCLRQRPAFFSGQAGDGLDGVIHGSALLPCRRSIRSDHLGR